jgi:hypothetical protein
MPAASTSETHSQQWGTQKGYHLTDDPPLQVLELDLEG